MVWGAIGKPYFQTPGALQACQYRKGSATPSARAKRIVWGSRGVSVSARAATSAEPLTAA
jgi:hypothetical protein